MNRLQWGAVVPALLLAGCSVSPGNRLNLFPEGHALIEQAQAMRQAASEPANLPRELDKRVLPPYTVEPGDILLVQAADLDSPVRLPGDQPVLPDGTINLGRYGRLIVAGKTVDQIELEVRAAIQTYLAGARAALPARPGQPKEPEALAEPRLPEPREGGPITVRVVTRVSKVYYVLGEVNAPGSFALNGRETVLDGILAAGGLNDRASRRTITLIRPTHADSCRVVLPVCYREIVQLGDTTTNYQLAPGDRIYVPTRTCKEEMHRNQSECPPCGRPQTPCAALHPGGGTEEGPGSWPLWTPPPRFTVPAPAENLPAPRSDAPGPGQPAPAEPEASRDPPPLWRRVASFLAP